MQCLPGLETGILNLNHVTMQFVAKNFVDESIHTEKFVLEPVMMNTGITLRYTDNGPPPNLKLVE